MSAHQGQQCQRDKSEKTSASAQIGQLGSGNNAGATTVTRPLWHEGKEVSAIRMTTPAQQGQQHLCNDAMASGQWGQQCHCDNGKDACTLTMATTPLWQGQKHQLDDSNNDITTRATALLQWHQRSLDCKTPAHKQWQHHHDEGNNTSLTTAQMPAHWWRQQPHCLQEQWCQLKDYASSTTAETPTWQGPQLPLQQRQICLCINGKNAIATRATTPSQWRHQRLRINADINAIVTRATMPAWWWQQCHHNKGNSAIANQGQQCHCYEGSNTIVTMARTPAHQQRQQHHHCEGNNCNHDNGKDAYALMATIQLWQGQQCQLNRKWQRQQC
jgi:hypothetical protein